MDLLSRSHWLNLSQQIIEWREGNNIIPDEFEFHWSNLHLSVVRNYFSEFSTTCDFRPAMVFAKIVALFTQELEEFFMVPRLTKFHESINNIKKYQLVEALISFLLQLLYHRTDSVVGPCKDRFDNLEKELRFLHTILGDILLMQCDEHEELQNLLAEFEAVANEAGSLVHSLFFSIDRASRKTDEGFAFIFNHIELLKANIIKFLDLLPFISGSACVTPKTSVVDSLLIVNSLNCDLEDLMNREDNPIAAVKDQIEILHQRLVFLQSSIKDIRSPQPSENGELKEPLMRIGDMAHEAEYLINSFVAGDAPLWYLITRLNGVNDKVELIATEFIEITKEYKSGGFEVTKYFGTRVKGNGEVDDVTVGFQDNVTGVLDHLVRVTGHLQVISIFGMPGVGKTTLAKKLYNHPLVKYNFDELSWCVVSQTYQRQRILVNILIGLTNVLSKDEILEMEEESLAERIYKTLKGRRYLIVMDDIWDSNVWYNLQRYFPDDGNGSGILFTSRNKDVAPPPPNSIIYELPRLSNDQCWELLEKKVFGNEFCPHELLQIGKKMAANCSGLPLAVVVTAGVLSTMGKEKSKWEEVEKNLASYFFDGEDNLVMQILELSYKHLPDHLKPCFLYFGAFEEDKEIFVGKLTRLWIVEGFVRQKNEKSAENVAEEYLMELINRSLVMVAKRRLHGGIKTCVIHDLLRDLCLKISKEENFLKLVDIYSVYEKGHRLNVLEASVTGSYCQHVRSYHGRHLTSPFYVRDMRLLRVLHFSYIRNHFIGIEFLVNLRYLIVTDLPKSLSNLVNLEYLRVETYMIVDLPPTIAKMRKLRYIHVGSEARYDKDWDSSQTNNLESLSCVRIKDEEMLKCSPHLRKLKCRFDQLLSQENGESQFVNLHFLNQLESLDVEFGGFGINVTSFPSNIRKLTLFGAKLVEMSIFGKLENLEILKLISIEFAEERWDTRDGEFQKLKILSLEQIKNLTEWSVDSSEHFPKLQQLVLRGCYNLQEIPCEIGEITTLQMIEVGRPCPESLVKSTERIQQQQLEIGNEDLVIINNSWLF